MSESGNDFTEEESYARNLALSTITEDDIAFENELILNPFCTRSWLRYVQHRLVDRGTARVIPDSHTALLYERAVLTLPGSYKLWKSYLLWSRSRLSVIEKNNHRSPRVIREETERIVGAYERALLTLHKMPRLWIDLLALLSSSCRDQVRRIRSTFDHALQALPTGQHFRIWELYLPWADSVGGYIAAHVYKRFLKIDPSRLNLYIRILLDLGRYNEAAQQLQKAIKIQAEAGMQTYDLFEHLCDLAVEHPEALVSVSVESILRSSLRHYPNHTAKFWTSLSRYWIFQGRLEKARDIFEEAIHTVLNMRDFSQLFETYVDFEENIITEKMRLISRYEDFTAKVNDVEELDDDLKEFDLEATLCEVDIRLLRLDKLLADRPFLVNDVMLRQNIHNVNEWLKRVSLCKDDDRMALKVFLKGIKKISPRLATGQLSDLWIAYARYYEDRADREKAANVFEEATKVNFKNVKDLSKVWIEYAEMWLRAKDPKEAIMVISRATAIPKNTKVEFYDKKLSPQRRLFKCTTLWSFYVDLEESFGSVQSVQAVYESILNLKIATPQTIVNYAMYLESRDYYEESFKAYERGIEIFHWPIAYEIWNIYLPKFLDRYGSEKIERLRDLFEMAIDRCPMNLSRSIYLLYAQFEEDHGLARRAMRIYERGVHAVAPTERVELYKIYVSRIVHYFGLVAAREVYERAMASLPDKQAAALGLDFGSLELRLGEVERARAIYAHGSQFCDPRTDPDYWLRWHEFEVKYGNEDTFKEMLRIKRSVLAQYNTELNYITAQLAAARSKQRLKEQQEEAEALAIEENADKQDKTISSLDAEEAIVAAGEKLGRGNNQQVATEKPIPAAVFGKALISGK